ncbi:MAG: DUF2484 family protein [Pseudomonadota bacterium]
MILIVICCVWVLASAAVAMLPMRRQYVPGVMLMLAAPVLIGAMALHYGSFLGVVALFAFLSMFRNPLIYMARRAMGQNPEIPK